jgi:putative transposase
MYKGIKLQIYPNLEQQQQIVDNFGCCRFVWNQMLNMQIERYKNNPDSKFLNGFAMNFLLKQLKSEHPWLKQVDSTSLQDTCETLAVTYQRFFKHIGSYPKFKSRKYPKKSYKAKMITNNIRLVNNHYLKLPKLGVMKFKGRLTTDKIKSATIKLSPAGKFYCVLLTECENQTLFDKTNKNVGLDMGVADLVITSDGIKYPTIRFDKILAKKKHYWEKRLARRRLQAQREMAGDKHNKVLEPRVLADFKNVEKAKIMVAKYSEKIANQRKDYLHKITTDLVHQYDVIKIEDLKTKNLLKNHKLARAIANQSWRELRSMLEYKCEWYGKQLVTVNPRKTSQICSNCGYDDGKHELNIRQWTCPKCGTNHDRDINAAINILQAS